MAEWKSLTDRDWVNVVNSDAVKAEGNDVHGAVCAAFKLIETKLREKNCHCFHRRELAEERHPGRQFSMIAKLGTRLGELLDEDHWAECEEMLLAIENGPWRNLATPVQEACQFCGGTRGHWGGCKALESPKCLTCGGSGWLGGPTFYEPGEGGERCPDCAAINERIRRLFVQHGHLYAGWLELGRSILALASPPVAVQEERDAKDAARYRWLRNESWAGYNQSKKRPQVAETIVFVADGAGNVKTVLAEAALDAAVDAAMKGDQP